MPRRQDRGRSPTKWAFGVSSSREGGDEPLKPAMNFLSKQSCQEMCLLNRHLLERHISDGFHLVRGWFNLSSSDKINQEEEFHLEELLIGQFRNQLVLP